MDKGNLSGNKKKAKKELSRIVFEDEASFRQDSTLCRTWSRKGCQPLVPVTGQRKSVKVFGAVDILSNKFIYSMDEVFNVLSYLNFLEYMATEMFMVNRKILFIQDNASYHKNNEIWKWFKENRKWIEVHNLPPYCPELNAAEPLWKYTRKSGTHNKCFESEDQIQMTLNSIFENVQRNPSEIKGYTSAFL